MKSNYKIQLGDKQFGRNGHKLHFVLLPPDTIIKITAKANLGMQFFLWSEGWLSMV